MRPRAFKPRLAPVLSLAYHSRVLEAWHRLASRRIVVIAYHRIADVESADFNTFVPNVSATPEAFAAQMDHLKTHYNVISIGDLLTFLNGGGSLPDRPALVTFDDGYRDNLVHAMPILRERGLPAVLFLATNCVGSAEPFYWDSVAYMFARSSCQTVNLPILGQQTLNGLETRRALANQWVMTAKLLPIAERRAAVDALRAVLDAPEPTEAFRDLYLTWDEVRELAANGIAIGAHTCSHPILSQLPPDAARDEIIGSKHAIETALGDPVRTFAYPNGGPNDYNRNNIDSLLDAGIEAAFTLAPGPTWPHEIRSHPLEIRRSLVTQKDDIPRFAAKLVGLGRVWKHA